VDRYLPAIDAIANLPQWCLSTRIKPDTRGRRFGDESAEQLVTASLNQVLVAELVGNRPLAGRNTHGVCELAGITLIAGTPPAGSALVGRA
jgi:hypothetical protein